MEFTVWIRRTLYGEVLRTLVMRSVIELEMQLGVLETLRIRVAGDGLLIIGARPGRKLNGHIQNNSR